MSGSWTDSTMSVATLPPPSAIHTTLRTASPSKRPKLSLDTTTSVPSFCRSKHSNSLRLETLSATSPTIRNTFGNSYTAQRSVLDNSRHTTTESQQYDNDYPNDYQQPAHPKPLQCRTTRAPADAAASLGTIAFPANLRSASILRNGTGTSQHHRRQSSMRSRSRSPSPAKRVVFRAPLTEEVKTTIYTLAHSDIEPPAALTSSPTSSPSASSLAATQELGRKHIQYDGLLLESTVYVAPRKAAHVRAVSETCPATPVAGRAKERQWQWTLGPASETNVTRSEATHNVLDSPSLMTVDVN